jgi:hypothetical protein
MTSDIVAVMKAKSLFSSKISEDIKTYIELSKELNIIVNVEVEERKLKSRYNSTRVLFDLSFHPNHILPVPHHWLNMEHNGTSIKKLLSVHNLYNIQLKDVDIFLNNNDVSVLAKINSTNFEVYNSEVKAFIDDYKNLVIKKLYYSEYELKSQSLFNRLKKWWSESF